MTDHTTGTRDEWIASRLELLKAEKELTRRSDELARWRQALPWVRIDKEYSFETDQGTASLADLFEGRSQLLIYHFMFGPDYTAGCPSCSAIADGFNGSAVHLANHDVSLCAVSRAPLAKIQAYKRRMGWTFPWASSYGSDFNFNFGVAHTKEEWESGAVAYNFSAEDLRPAAGEGSSRDAFSQSIVGTDWETYRREGPGVSAFALEDGVVYHTYSAALGHVPVARPHAPWAQRNWPLVASPRRVQQRVTRADGLIQLGTWRRLPGSYMRRTTSWIRPSCTRSFAHWLVLSLTCWIGEALRLKECAGVPAPQQPYSGKPDHPGRHPENEAEHGLGTAEDAAQLQGRQAEQHRG
jgi:predicted dithiol-disulfide oxidoreductase (DUF899 family)